MGLLNWRTPSYTDFGLPDPPADLRHLLYVNPANATEPLPVDLPGGGSAWFAGWFALRLPSSATAGIELFVNGSHIDRLTLEDVPETCGAFGFIVRSEAGDTFEKFARETLNAHVSERLHTWVEE